MEKSERKLVRPFAVSYLRMFLKLPWRTREMVRIRALGGILIRNFVSINIPVLLDIMLCRHQCCCLFRVCSRFL